MTPNEGRPLLRITRHVLKFASVLSALGMTVAALVVGILAFTSAQPNYSGTLARMDPVSARQAAIVFGATAIIACALSLWVLAKLQRIIESAIAGDPFTGDNARRLRHIGWILLVMNVTGPLALAVASLMRLGDPVDSGLAPVSPSFAGLLTVLLVFVIARIFEQGAQMRSDLQGTV